MIRCGSIEDAGDIVRIITTAFEPYRGRLVPESGALSETVETISDKLQVFDAAIAEIDNVPVGCVLYHFRHDIEVYVGRLAVLPEYQGCGIAKQLLAFVENDAKNLGAIRLTLNVRIPLVSNQQLFLDFGFYPMRRDYHPGSDVPTRIVMEKNLLGDHNDPSH